MAHTDAIHAVYQDPIALVELIERRKWARMFWTNPTDDVCRRGHDGHAKGWKKAGSPMSLLRLADDTRVKWDN